ncbi:MAG: hypothetical protein KatS3mg060_1972 [Dehalococcoidia bacterium]|jgi:hypothetical protein|nr:MAG: hypothetical protein KatS3mg060_1972 [Dehalococcoidia bacterium]
MRRIVLLVTTLVIAGATLIPAGGALTQELFRYYPETGHYVKGDWLAWYLAHGGPERIGAPRTEDFKELDRLVQYFRTIRLEWDCGPDGRQPCRLRPGTLGEQILGRSLDLTPDRQSAGVRIGDTRVFAEVGLSVSGEFLAVFDELGGVEFFGLPLTGEVVEAGQTVQWFQRARLQRDADGVVRLSRLGDYWIDTLKRVPLIATLRQPPPAPAPALPVAGPTLSGHIAYRSAAGEIILVSLADGTERVVGAGAEPALSPDGTRIAYVRTGEQPGVWVIDLRTGNEERVATDAGVRSPVWSPDGTRLAMLRSKQDPVRGVNPVTRRPGWFLEDHYSVMVVDVATRTTTDLPSLTFSSFPSWSSDGTRIVFDGNTGLYLIPTDGTGVPTVIPNTNRLTSQPAWSPDGQRLALVYKRNDNVDLAIMNVDGTGFQLLTESPRTTRQSNNVAPVWSPDGRWIAFLSDRDGAWQVYAIDPETRVIRPLLAHDLGVAFTFADERALSWSR